MKINIACSKCGCVIGAKITKRHWEMDVTYLTVDPKHNVGIQYGTLCPNCDDFAPILIEILYTRKNSTSPWIEFRHTTIEHEHKFKALQHLIDRKKLILLKPLNEIKSKY